MERFETKYDLLNRAYRDTRLKRTTKALMQYLVAKADQLSCHPSVATIAAAIRMSERTVQRHMRLLEKYGYLIRRSRYYRDEQLTNQYEFILDVIDAAEGFSTRNLLKEQAEKCCDDTSNFNKIQCIKQIGKTKLSNKERLVLIYLVHKANQNGIAYGNIHKISKELHMSQRLLWRVILSLREEGYCMLKNQGKNIIVKLNQETDKKEEVYAEETENGQKINKGAEEEIVYPESEKVCFENNDGGRHGADARYPAKKSKGKLKQFLHKCRRTIQRILVHFLS